MANHKSAEKRMRQNATRRAQNRTHRSALRTQIKKFRDVVVEGDDQKIEDAFVQTQREVDRAVSRGLIHRNKAARVKSRLLAEARRSQSPS